MPSVPACSLSSGSTPKFALVSYIGQPLAGFLDQLRRDLDPGCKPRAHVTLLPPRILCSSQERAAREIRTLSRHFQPFEIHLGDVSKFCGSNVIHLELAGGRDRLLEMHRAMNCGASQFKEGYEYCPHVTIAQYLDPAVVDETFERARAAWESYPFEKSFTVDTLSFVRSLDCANWVDLEDFPLRLAPPTPGITRINHPEPHPA
jgi:2'-5' RNA ligase